ncbi:MAG: MogA/MoaB family molybdenum cofactor biosynthesis protein [Treponemataceae bacterium]
MFSYAIIIASDKGFSGERKDLCADIIKQILSKEECTFVSTTILPDEQDMIEQQMKKLSDSDGVDLIITSGGTGFSLRDVTPEATKNICTREVPGFGEAQRAYSMQFTNKAMLSRATAGIRNKTLIVNLPGSPKAVTECLSFILEPLIHGVSILKGLHSECAR